MFLTIILIAFTTLLLEIFFWFKINFNYWTHHPKVPSVKGRIFSGNFKDFVTHKKNFGYHLRTIYEDKRFKNEAVVGIYGLYRPALLIREPELLKSIFIKDFDLFRNRFSEGGKHDPLGSMNLFFARYNQWKESRTKLSPVFSSGKLKNMYPLIQKVGENLQDLLQKQPEYFVNELKDLSGRYAIDMISTTILGTTCKALENPKEVLLIEAHKLAEFNFKRALEALVIFFAPKLNSLLKPRVFYKSTEKFIRPLVKQIMEERERTSVTRGDLIDTFVKIKKEAEDKGENVYRCMEGIISNACLLLLAAFDASSSAISLTLLELAKHPQEQKRLRKEILKAFLHENGEISYESLSNLEYLQMVINETLRLYPILAILERKHEFLPNKSSGFNLKPYYDYELTNEMPVYIPVLALHYDEKVRLNI